MMVEVVLGRGNRHVLQGGSLPKKVRFGLAGAVKDEDSLGLSLRFIARIWHIFGCWIVYCL
jgi:hypothetical protein